MISSDALSSEALSANAPAANAPAADDLSVMADSSTSPETEAGLAPAILALDTGSPTVSVALAQGGDLLAADVVEIGHSSRRLLPMIDAALGRAGVAAAELGGIVALAGPGSFTGLRVGLATAMGLHQALGAPATAVPTLPALARTVPADGPTRVFALVDVLRDEWACQEAEHSASGTFRTVAGAERLPVEEVLARVEARLDGVPVVLAGFGVEALRSRLSPTLKDALEAGGLRFHQPDGLAATAALAAAAEPPVWDPAALTAPLYFRPPATTSPKRRGSPPAAGA